MSTTIHIDNNQTITITANTTTLADLRDAINLKGGYLQNITPDINSAITSNNYNNNSNNYSNNYSNGYNYSGYNNNYNDTNGHHQQYSNGYTSPQPTSSSVTTITALCNPPATNSPPISNNSITAITTNTTTNSNSNNNASKIDIVASTIKIPAGVFSYVNPNKKSTIVRQKRKSTDDSSLDNVYSLKHKYTKTNKNVMRTSNGDDVTTPKDDESDEDYEDDVEIGGNQLEKLKVAKRAPQVTIKNLVEENYLAAGDAVEFKASGVGVVQGEITTKGTVRDVKKKHEYEYLNHWANAYKMKTINWAHVTVTTTNCSMLDIKKKYYSDHPHLFE